MSTICLLRSCVLILWPYKQHRGRYNCVISLLFLYQNLPICFRQINYVRDFVVLPTSTLQRFFLTARLFHSFHFPLVLFSLSTFFTRRTARIRLLCFSHLHKDSIRTCSIQFLTKASDLFSSPYR